MRKKERQKKTEKKSAPESTPGPSAGNYAESERVSNFGERTSDTDDRQIL